MKNFEGFGLNPALCASLERMNYTKPTPIQAQAIPLALSGRDIMGSAQTGTGKTAAFAIPVVEMLLSSDVDCALVLTPTRELGKQVMDIMHQLLGSKSGVKTAFLIGGEPMGKQINALNRRPRLVVGTPGRINDHLERGNLHLAETTFLVLDETDRMLDMGFSVQLDRIFKYLPSDRQTLMFSATLPKNILKLSEQYLNKPERVAVGSTTDPSKNIKQEIIRLNEDDKYDELVRQLDKRSGSVIVFVKTRHNTEKLAKRLSRENFEAEAIHGELRQNHRDRVIRNFREQKYRILVATDVAARGLDIPHIEHVINYDLPQVAEDYIHRIGRTARAGAEGEALCLIAPQDGRKWHAIEMLMNPGMKKPEKAVRPRGKSSKFKGRGRGGAGDGFKARVARGENPYAPKRKNGGFKNRPPRDDNAQGENRNNAAPKKAASNGDRYKPEGKKNHGANGGEGFKSRGSKNGPKQGAKHTAKNTAKNTAKSGGKKFGANKARGDKKFASKSTGKPSKRAVA